MKKKFVAVVLSLAMTLSLVACGNSSSDTAGSTANNSTAGSTTNEGAAAADGETQAISLKVWVPEEEMEMTQELCTQFDEAHPEWDITFEIAVTGIDESVNSLEADPELAADVFQIPSGSVAQVVGEGLLLPIGYQIEEVKALYSENAMAAGMADGLVYGIPFSPNSWFMFYNKNLFTEDEVKSLETMMEKDLGADTYNFSCDISNSWYIEAWFYAAGATLFGADGTDPSQCDWNSEAGLAATQYLIDMVNNPKYMEEADGIAGSLFKEGKLGAVCTGTWSAPEFLEALGDDLGAVALPTIKINGSDSHLANFADYKCYAVKSNTAQPLAAQQLAEYLCGEEGQLARHEASMATPTCLSLMDNQELTGDIGAVALMAQTEYSIPQPAITQINNYWTPAQTLGEAILRGEVDQTNMQATLDKVVSDILSSGLGE